MRQLARSYLQHGRRHSEHGSDPIPGLASAQSAYLWTQTTQTFPGDSGGQPATWDHFQTTDPTVFGTNHLPADGANVPTHNTAGDANLVLLQAGAYVIEATARWDIGQSNMYAEINPGTVSYLDDGKPTAIGDLASTVAPESSEEDLMTQSIKLYTLTPADAPNWCYLQLDGSVATTYTLLSYSMVAHWLGGGIGDDHVVY